VAFAAARSPVRYVVRAEPGRRDEVLRALAPRLLAIDRDRDIVVQTVADLRVSYDGQSVLVVRALSLVLALVVFVTLLGVVGVTSFSVAERTRQIGIRRAIGATRRDVVAHFLLESSIVSGAGLALGVGLAYALNVALVTRLGAGRIEPARVAAALFGLALGTGAATLIPALRAAKVAPTIATRSV
jgi:putative ABC transport system permease protein